MALFAAISQSNLPCFSRPGLLLKPSNCLSTTSGIYVSKRWEATRTHSSSRDDAGETSTSNRSDAKPLTPPSTSKPFPFRAISVLAAAGLLETSYLTFTKLSGGEVACPLSGGCATILTSSYASLWGVVPLSAAGMVAYVGVATLAYLGSLAAARQDEDAQASLRTAMVGGGALLGTTSAYLLWVLATSFPGEICPWCLGSAGISFSIAALALSGLRKRELEEAAAPGFGLAAATFLALSLGLGTPDASLATTGISELPYSQPVISTESPAGASDLARRLRDAGAKMYGAFWCSHCYEQKQIFGSEAMESFPYVECFPEGWKQGVEMADSCKAVDGLQGFPTWVIGDTKLEGAQSLETLTEALDKIQKS